jgi:hypothetical protein
MSSGEESYIRLNPQVPRIDSRVANGLGLSGYRREGERVRYSRGLGADFISAPSRARHRSEARVKA